MEFVLNTPSLSENSCYYLGGNNMLIKLPLGSEFYTKEGMLKDDLKYRINVDEFKIRDAVSKNLFSGTYS